MSTDRFAQSIDQVGTVRPLPGSPDAFESVYYPENRIYSTEATYGGFAVATGLRGAFETVDHSVYSLFSLNGNFLGPAISSQKLRVRVRRIRDTRTFATRFVEISQLIATPQTQSQSKSLDKSQDSTQGQPQPQPRTSPKSEKRKEKSHGPKERLVMTLTADFHRPEAALVTTNPTPTLKYESPETSRSQPELARYWGSRGLPKPIVDEALTLFSMTDKFWDRRLPMQGMMTQNLYGLAAGHIATDQDQLPIQDRRSADYVCARGTLTTVPEHMGALAFYADSGLSWLAMVHTSTPPGKASLWATLEFSMRFHASDIRFDEWIFREMKFVGAAEGRTFSEARYWDPRGRLICTASQVCILRSSAPQARM